MSGGSMNYLYRRILWESDFEETTELRSEFRRHLVLVAGALMDIEWVDSGDMAPGDEDESIALVLGSGRSKFTNQCGETCERAKMCATCARELVAVEYSPPRHDKELLSALKDAADAIEHWGAYVPDYFQSKHDLQADIDRARGVIAKAEESTK